MKKKFKMPAETLNGIATVIALNRRGNVPGDVQLCLRRDRFFPGPVPTRIMGIPVVLVPDGYDDVDLFG